MNFFTQILAIIAAGFLTWLAKFYWGWRHKLNQKLTLKLIWQALAGLSLLPVGLSLILNWSLSGIIDLFPILNDGKYTLNDWTARPISIWIKENTQPNAVILTTTYLYHPASLVGRKIFLDYGYFAWSLGYEDQKRRQLLPKLFGQFAKTQDWCKALARENISAVVVSPGESELGSFISIQDSFMIKKLSPTIKTSDNYLVFKLADYCLPVSK